MNIERSLRDGIIAFNDRQAATGRVPLTALESNMLVAVLHNALAKQMGQIRGELELAASQANIEVARELDWATDIIVATMRMDNRMSVSLRDEQIQKFAAGFVLHVEREEGVTELELTVDKPDAESRSE